MSEHSFAVLANGASNAPPASGVRDYLVACGARVVSVFHPLGPEHAGRHEITHFEGGRARRREIRLPSAPPVSYPLDLIVPPILPKVDGWIAFNNLLCAQGLAARAAGRADRVVYWAVDFVPDRFGADSPLTRLYDALDRTCCLRADARLEVSESARAGRDERHGISSAELAPTAVAPIGAWVDRAPTATRSSLERRRAIFIGHLVPRMGVETFIRSLAVLRDRGDDVVGDIAGDGPLLADLQELVEHLDLADRVTFHGYISDHQRLEGLLAEAAVGIAPYDTHGESFTRFADPSKLKSYLAAGLPIILTDVPPNARELARQAGAAVVADDPQAVAAGIAEALASPAAWARRSGLARAYAERFDWRRIVPEALGLAGFAP